MHAPLLCEVHTRVCVAGTCELKWDKGCSQCIHVQSRDSCTGDEIGHMFVNRVMASGITFSAFCDDMNRTYKLLNKSSHNFMSLNVFISW